MKTHASVFAVTLITLALVGCSKKPAPTAITQQKASGIEVVTNDNGYVTVFQNVIKRNTDSAPAAHEASSIKVVTNEDGSVTTFTSRIKRNTNSAPETKGLSK